MQGFRKLPIAGLAIFTIGVIVSRAFDRNFVASVAVVFLVLAAFWTVGTEQFRRNINRRSAAFWAEHAHPRSGSENGDG